MGKSAKLHKRVKKQASSSTGSTTHGSNQKTQAVQTARKRGAFKDKTRSSSSSRKGQDADGHVLGGADYVSLMMGGRRKAQEEAKKLPMGED